MKYFIGAILDTPAAARHAVDMLVAMEASDVVVDAAPAHAAFPVAKTTTPAPTPAVETAAPAAEPAKTISDAELVAALTAYHGKLGGADNADAAKACRAKLDAFNAKKASDVPQANRAAFLATLV